MRLIDADELKRKYAGWYLVLGSQRGIVGLHEFGPVRRPFERSSVEVQGAFPPCDADPEVLVHAQDAAIDEPDDGSLRRSDG